MHPVKNGWIYKRLFLQKNYKKGALKPLFIGFYILIKTQNLFVHDNS